MKNRLTHNLGLKIASIIAAAAVWLIIMNIEDPVVTETFYNIPVKIMHEEVVTSRGYQYSIESGENIDVRVKGKRSIVDNLTEADFEATADFNSFIGMYMAQIIVKCVSHSEEELLVSTSTETMAIKLEESDTVPFSVRVIQNGAVKEGYYVRSTTAGTGLIQVTGSKTEVANIKEVTVEIDVEGKKDTFSVDCTPTAYDYDGNPMDPMKISFSQDFITVEVGICPTKTVEVAVETSGEPGYGFYVDNISFAPASILIAGTEELLTQLDKITIPCDIQFAREDVNLQINLEDFISETYGAEYILVGENSTVAIVVAIKEMEQKEVALTKDSVEIRNLREGLLCSLYAVSNTTVKIMGRPEDIQDIEAVDLKLYIDVRGCIAGTYSRTLLSDYQGDVIFDMDAIMIGITEVRNEEETDGT